MPRLWLFLLLLLAGGCGDTQLAVHLPQGIHRVWIYVDDKLVREGPQRCEGEACYFSLAPAVSAGQTINILAEQIDKTQAGLVVATRLQSKMRDSFYTNLEFAAEKFEPSKAPTNESLTSVWGAGDDLWAVGTNQVILHLNRSHWTTAKWQKESLESGSCPMPATLNGVGGADPDGVWAVGEQNLILKRKNGVWISDNGSACGGLQQAWRPIVSMGTQVFVSGFDEVRNEVVKQLFPTPMSSISLRMGLATISVPRSMVSLGTTLAVLDDEGALWEVDPGGSKPMLINRPGGNMQTLWAAKDTLFAGGAGPEVQMRQNGIWETSGLSSTPTVTVNGLWGPSDSAPNLWAVGQNSFLAHRVGSMWTVLRAGEANLPNYNAIWGDATGFWVVGDGGTIQHYYYSDPAVIAATAP